MIRMFHMWWQIAAVVLFTTVLVMQIPRKALFFKPAAIEPPEPFVTILSLDDREYAGLVQRIRMSWQIRGRSASGAVADSRTDAFSFADAMPPPAYMPYRPHGPAPALPPPESRSPALVPPSLGEGMPRLVPPPVLPDRDRNLLELPGTLPGDTSPGEDFTLKFQRNQK